MKDIRTYYDGRNYTEDVKQKTENTIELSLYTMRSKNAQTTLTCSDLNAHLNWIVAASRVCVSCFPLHLFRALPLSACFTTELSTVEASLFVKYSIAIFL